MKLKLLICRYSQTRVYPFQKLCRPCFDKCCDIAIEAANRELGNSFSASMEVDGPDPLVEPDPDISAEGAKAEAEFRKEENKEAVQDVMLSLGLPPIKLKKKEFMNKEYMREVVHETGNAIRDKLNLDPVIDFEKQLILNMKKKLEGKSKQEIIDLLSVLPEEDWCEFRLMKEFGVTRSTAASIVETRRTGLLPVRKVGTGCPIPESTLQLAAEFYEKPYISRAMTGSRDFIKIKDKNGNIVPRNKCVLLQSLTETYELFKSDPKYKNLTIGRSTFAECKPPWVVFASDRCVEKLCLCIHHENPERILKSSVLSSLDIQGIISEEYEGDVDALLMAEKLTCVDDDEACWLRTCPKCKNARVELELRICGLLEDAGVLEVAFEEFLHTDRTAIQKLSMQYQIFAGHLCDLLEVLLPHHYITIKQKKYFYHLSSNLPINTVLACGDFA